MGPIKSLGLWVMYAIIGMFFGLIIFWISKAIYNSNFSDAESQAKIEINCSKSRVADITNKQNEDYLNYVESFENEAQKLSVKFAESKLATQVIEWMTEGFDKTIKAANRQSHIQQIIVPFMFKVFSNKITCNLGAFDFEIKRCRNLNDHLEQIALVRAICSNIQLNIAMKYPQDLSEISNKIDYDFLYGEDYVSSTITYSDPNGNYQSVQD